MLEILIIALSSLIVIIIGCTCWVIHYMLVNLPEQQKDILGRYGMCIVNQVVLQYASLSEEQQKQIAEEKMKDIFKDFGVAAPGDSAIEVTIANAIYRHKQYHIRFEEEMPVTPAMEAA